MAGGLGGYGDARVAHCPIFSGAGSSIESADCLECLTFCRGIGTCPFESRKMQQNRTLQISGLAEAYQNGRLDPETVVRSILHRTRDNAPGPIWLHLLPEEDVLAQLTELRRMDSSDARLFGIPFAIKDNMDLAGHPTTAGCPDYPYVPSPTAPAVARLLAAGAILIGKTAMDQFATGTTGTRSPHGPCPNALNPDYISGGSSSGSAVVVASDLVSFSLGTDTAGSGRIPAALNGIIGLKPTRGLVSIRGLVPACRSIDCVSVFARCIDDAQKVLGVLEG
jgi:allophanate hydrolase